MHNTLATLLKFVEVGRPGKSSRNGAHVYRRTLCTREAHAPHAILQFSILWSCFFKTRRSTEETLGVFRILESDATTAVASVHSGHLHGVQTQCAPLNAVHTALCVHIAPARLSTLLLSSEQPLSSIVLQTVTTRGSNVRRHCIYLSLVSKHIYKRLSIH